ncbi:thioredoxin [Nocardioides sp. Soil797]|nr:thioredoxin [Nocardioides sp. Soil797]
MSTGQIVLLIVVPLALGFGAWRGWTDGRFRGTHKVHGSKPTAPTEVEDTVSVLSGTDIDHTLGEKATLLQFSSAFCAPCRATRRILGDIADVVPGVTHVEVDAEKHLELVRRVGILRTPTTLILDAQGREVTRASGAPRKEQVISALAQV